MKPKITMVHQACKSLRLSEWSVVAAAHLYNSGKGWLNGVDIEEVNASVQELSDGYVSTLLEDFCLDYLSGRVSPNCLMVMLDKICSSKTQKIRRKK